MSGNIFLLVFVDKETMLLGNRQKIRNSNNTSEIIKLWFLGPAGYTDFILKIIVKIIGLNSTSKNQIFGKCCLLSIDYDRIFYGTQLVG